jgi:hypothetical protein
MPSVPPGRWRKNSNGDLVQLGSAVNLDLEEVNIEEVGAVQFADLSNSGDQFSIQEDGSGGLFFSVGGDELIELEQAGDITFKGNIRTRSNKIIWADGSEIEEDNNGNFSIEPASNVSINDGDIDMNNNTITNLPTPQNPGEAASKSYADTISSGVQAIKDAVTAATDGTNIDLTSATDPNPVDGVTLSDGDRVLLKDQTDATENGIYDAVTATDPTTWTRSSDFDEDAEVIAGARTFVQEGTNNGSEVYIVTSSDPITVGSDNIAWTLLSASDVQASDFEIIDLSASGGTDGQIVQVNSSGGLEYASASSGGSTTNVQEFETESDLPAPTNGTITLDSNTVYRPVGSVPLTTPLEPSGNSIEFRGESQGDQILVDLGGDDLISGSDIFVQTFNIDIICQDQDDQFFNLTEDSQTPQGSQVFMRNGNTGGQGDLGTFTDSQGQVVLPNVSINNTLNIGPARALFGINTVGSTSTFFNLTGLVNSISLTDIKYIGQNSDVAVVDASGGSFGICRVNGVDFAALQNAPNDPFPSIDPSSSNVQFRGVEFQPDSIFQVASNPSDPEDVARKSYVDTASQFSRFGTGSDGSYTSGDNLEPGKVYNFTDFTLEAGDTLSLTSNSVKPVRIKVQGDVKINGTIDISGQCDEGYNSLKVLEFIAEQSLSSPFDPKSIGDVAEIQNSQVTLLLDEMTKGGEKQNLSINTRVPGAIGYNKNEWLNQETKKINGGTPGGNGVATSDVAFGGGGGASYDTNGRFGDETSTNDTSTEGLGGNGGGAVLFECAGDFIFNGTIDISGEDGGDADGGAGGGGGAGGMFYALYAGSLTDSGTKIVSGGAGGDADGNGGSSSADGGSGADGEIKFEEVSF